MQSSTERKFLYRTLAALFRYPEASLLAPLHQSIGELADLLHLERPAAWQQAPELSAWEAEYTSLFVNSFGGTPAPPYGSVYLDPGGRLMGESSLQVAACYQAEQLNLQESTEPPDFLATELEYLYYLVDEEEAAAASDQSRLVEVRQKQAEFLKRFLLPWLPEFRARVVASSSAKLYPWLVEALEVFLRLAVVELESRTDP